MVPFFLYVGLFLLLPTVVIAGGSFADKNGNLTVSNLTSIEQAYLVKSFVKRLRWKGPIFSISALTREGCEGLVRAVYDHVAAQVRPAVEERDPRFDPVDADGAR